MHETSPSGDASAELMELFSEADYPVQVLYNEVPPLAHRHPELEFSIVLRGRGEYFVRDQAYELEPGTGLIVHSDEVHYGIPSRCSGVLRAVLIFDPDLIERRPGARRSLDDLTRRTHFFLSSSGLASVEFLLKEIADELVQRRSAWHDIVECDLERFLLLLRRSDFTRPPSSVGTKDTQFVRAVVAHLERTFSRRQSVDDIARHFGVSRSSLQRAFKGCTGSGIKDFTIRLRVMEAKRMLEQTDMKIASVAYGVGFDNLSAFNRDFRLHTGVSPSDYRALTRTRR